MTNDLTEILTPSSWVTSDHHWVARGGRAYRTFPDRPADWAELARREWQRLVGHEDVVLHLGDLVERGSWAASEDDFSWLDGLPGRKYLILGNADKETGEAYREWGFTVLGRGDRPYYWETPDGALVAFSHEPMRPADHPFDANVHGHTHAGEAWSWYGAAFRANACVERWGYAPARVRDVLASRRWTGAK